MVGEKIIKLNDVNPRDIKGTVEVKQRLISILSFLLSQSLRKHQQETHILFLIPIQ